MFSLRSETLVSSFQDHLSLLDHRHECDTDPGVLRGIERFQPEHRPYHPLDSSLVLFHHIISIFACTDGDRCAVSTLELLIAASWGRSRRSCSSPAPRGGG